MERKIGVRELRQDASAILRDVENGDTFTVTVNGRPVARLIQCAERLAESHTWDQLGEIFDLAPGVGVMADVAMPGTVTDPWEARARPGRQAS